jgi:hypothetical protein
MAGNNGRIETKQPEIADMMQNNRFEYSLSPLSAGGEHREGLGVEQTGRPKAILERRFDRGMTSNVEYIPIGASMPGSNAVPAV